MVGRFRRRAALRAVVVVTLAVLVDPIGVVQAQNVPTDREVERAREAQERVDEAVADAQARLDSLAKELDDARVHAAIAVEEYNGARVELARARRAEESAVIGAAAVRQEETAADLELGRLAAAAYRSGGELSRLRVVMNILTDSSMDDVSEALAAVTRSQSAVHARWSAALETAESEVRVAEQQVIERTAAERAAEAALERAKQAVAEHELKVAQAETIRDLLMIELATARETTGALERDRLRADEQREQDERRRAEEERAARADAGAGQGADDHSQPDRAEQAGDPTAPEPGRTGGAESSSGDEVERDARTAPDPEVNAATTTGAEPAGPSFAGSSGAQLAIDYARAQLGRPYVWAGAGPDGFDCSGLIMRAWERGGAQLTHWSVAQARQSVQVSYSDLRPGDLVFWSSNDAPSGAYHVGLYIGGGEMIHAPSPGGHVEIRNVFYWRTPSFYTRVVT